MYLAMEAHSSRYILVKTRAHLRLSDKIHRGLLGYLCKETNALTGVVFHYRGINNIWRLMF